MKCENGAQICKRKKKKGDYVLATKIKSKRGREGLCVREAVCAWGWGAEGKLKHAVCKSPPGSKPLWFSLKPEKK